MPIRKTSEPGRRRIVVMASYLIKICVFAGLIALVFKLFEDPKLLEHAQQLSVATVVAFFALDFCNRVAVAMRWAWICRRQLGLSGVSWLFLLRLNLVAEFIVIWLPSSLVAEGVRLWRMNKRTNSIPLSTASIVVDRVFGLLGLIVCTLPFLPAMQGSDALAVSPGAIALILFGLAASAVVCIAMLRRYRGPIALLRRASELLQRISILSPAMLFSCLSFVLIAAAQIFVYQELTTLSWVQIVPLVLVPMLGRLIPISLFGVSVVEGGTLLLGGMLSIDSESLLLVVGLVVLSRYLCSTIGVFWELGVEGWSGLSEVLSSPQEVLSSSEEVLSSSDD